MYVYKIEFRLPKIRFCKHPCHVWPDISFTWYFHQTRFPCVDLSKVFYRCKSQVIALTWHCGTWPFYPSTSCEEGNVFICVNLTMPYLEVSFIRLRVARRVMMTCPDYDVCLESPYILLTNFYPLGPRVWFCCSYTTLLRDQRLFNLTFN